MATSTRIKGIVFQLINQLTCRSLINSVEEHVYADQGSSDKAEPRSVIITPFSLFPFVLGCIVNLSF